jgi:drug/metabolite transporter (DMT)-like permease
MSRYAWIVVVLILLLKFAPSSSAVGAGLSSKRGPARRASKIGFRRLKVGNFDSDRESLSIVRTTFNNICEIHGECIGISPSSLLVAQTTTLPPAPSWDVHVPKPVARLLTFVCAMVCGSNYVITKQLQKSIPIELLFLLKLALSSLFFLKHVIFFRGNSDTIVAGFELGMWSSLGVITQMIGLKTVSTSKVALVVSLSSIMPPLFDFIEAKMNRKGGVALPNKQKTLKFPTSFFRSKLIPPILAMLGGVLVERRGLQAMALEDLLLLISPISFAMYCWRLERVVQRFPKEGNVLVGIVLLISSIVCCFWAIWQSQLPLRNEDWLRLWSLFSSDLSKLAMLLFLAVFGSAFTTYCDQTLFKALSAAEITVIYALEPIVASLAAYLALGEHYLVGRNQIFGAMLIISACLYGSVCRD